MLVRLSLRRNHVQTFFYRSCIGQRFARLELYIMMTKVVQRFKLEYDGEPVGSITRWVGGWWVGTYT